MDYILSGEIVQDDQILEKILNLSLMIAQISGNHILRQFNTDFIIDFKSLTNMVTQVDRESEQILISHIHDQFPDHRILAEETDDEIAGNSPYRWIIDPLDGTTNFVHGVPIFAISIAVEYHGEIIIGVVFDPTRNELFSAIKNGGAFLNKKQIKVSNTPTLSKSLTATGFPYMTDKVFDLNMEIFRTVYKKCQGVRRAGAAALDLCYVAAGRFDGFWEFGLNPWDVSAGALIVQEAGGIISDFKRIKFRSDNVSQIIATNGKIHEELLKIIHQTQENSKELT